MRLLSKKWIVLIFVIITLGILNPTYTNFKEFTGLSGKSSQALHKKYNFLICTIYENDFTSKRYLGILKNFIDISPNKKRGGNNIDEGEEDIPDKDTSIPITDSSEQIK